MSNNFMLIFAIFLGHLVYALCKFFSLCVYTSHILDDVFLYRERLLPCMVPHVGMEFKCSDEAGMFWHRYGGQKGFEVKKRYTNKRHQMTKLHHLDMFMEMRVIEDKTRGII